MGSGARWGGEFEDSADGGQGANLEDRPKGDFGEVNPRHFFNTTAPGILLLHDKGKPKARQGKVFLINANLVLQKGDAALLPSSFFLQTSDPDIQRRAETLIGWQEEETARRDSASMNPESKPQSMREGQDNLSRILDHAEPFHPSAFIIHPSKFSPSRYIHTSDAETYRPIAEIVEELKVIEAEARETDKALKEILEKIVL